MDDIVAVEVKLMDGSSRYFVTWGRIQDPVDPEPVCVLVIQVARSCSLDGEPVSARLCHALREAARSTDAPYFYECFFKFAQEKIPFGDGHESWRLRKDELMRSGREIAYCGSP